MHLPLYALQHGDRLLLAPHVRLFAAAGAPALHVSWPHVAAHLRYPELRQPDTCLSGVREIAPGTLERIGGHSQRQTIWSPRAFALQRPAPRDVAASALRKTTITCVANWARNSGRVAVSASGGLDSSIVCAALAAASEPFDCVTIATPDASGDESAYVRLLAVHFGVRVLKRTFDPALIDLRSSASVGLPRPTRKAFMIELQRLLAEAAGQLGARAVFDGNGGDNLFCFLHSAAPIIDRMRREGCDRALLRTYMDMCRITDCDLATMARAVLRGLRRQQRSWEPDDRLLAAAPQTPVHLTPWHCDVPPELPGKARHVELILRSQNFIHGLAEPAAPLAFSPLMSQPLIELCLSIPTWDWCAGGINRSLAREAFREDLPAAILARRSKAGPDSVLRSVFERNRALMRDMLLSGALAARGLIDCSAVEQALRVDEHADDPIVNRLLDLVEAEAWARSWS
jgi:asparagine synthase (glutamine-hydrolysing)